MINLDDPSGQFGLGLEKEATFKEMVKNASFFGKIGWGAVRFLVKRIGYMPEVYFEKEDVDEDVVKKLLKHPELLRAVQKWIEDTDYKLVPELKKAKKVFEAIHRPKKRGNILYRGFRMDIGQQTHGLGEKLKEMKEGDKFTDTPEKLTSFSSYKETTHTFGNVIVSIDYGKEDHRLFHITNEIMVAYMMLDEAGDDIDAVFPKTGKVFGYFESVLIPDGKPLEMTLVAK